MARICELCSKSYLKANLVPRGVGRRVTNRSISRQQPNIRSKRLIIGGTPVKMDICSSCLKRLKFEKKLVEKQQVAEQAAAQTTNQATK